jgi:hypothetical protein
MLIVAIGLVIYYDVDLATAQKKAETFFAAWKKLGLSDRKEPPVV